MASEFPQRLNDPRLKLRPERFDEFLQMVDAGATDFELAMAFGLRERTATNWRQRLVARRSANEKAPGDQPRGASANPQGSAATA